MNDKKKAPADQAGAEIQNPREERITMNDTLTTPQSTRHDVDAALAESTGLHLYLEQNPNDDEPPQLHLADGGGSVRIGSAPETAALAEALTALVPPVPEVDPRIYAAAEREWEAAEARAQATDCGIPGCDRQLHTQAAPAEWSHMVRMIENGDLFVYVLVEPDGQTRAHPHLHMEPVSGLDAAGLRAMVRQLTTYAAVLTSLSTELEG